MAKIIYTLIHYKSYDNEEDTCVKCLLCLTRTVNFSVRSSLSKGSWVGCKIANPSLLLMASCCSYRAKARWTSNFRAAKNFNAVLQDTGPARLPALHLFTASINSFVAWKKIIKYTYEYLYLKRRIFILDKIFLYVNK